MAILTGPDTRVIIQGITGNVGRGFVRRFTSQNVPLVGGVTPGRGGETVDGLRVFGSCHDAVAATGANASFVVVPGAFALDAAIDAVDAGIKLLVLYIEGVPVMDAVRLTTYARARGATVLGPNSAGCIAPAGVNMSELDPKFLLPGRIGVVAKSGAMCAESSHYLREAGLGVSSVVSIGGDMCLGAYHGDILALFENDPETDGVVMVGEIGGRSEFHAAETVRRMKKPVVAVIIGGASPDGKQMGHPGARQGEPDENAPAKREVLKAAGAVLGDNVTQVGSLMRGVLNQGVRT